MTDESKIAALQARIEAELEEIPDPWVGPVVRGMHQANTQLASSIENKNWTQARDQLAGLARETRKLFYIDLGIDLQGVDDTSRAALRQVLEAVVKTVEGSPEFSSHLETEKTVKAALIYLKDGLSKAAPRGTSTGLTP